MPAGFPLVPPPPRLLALLAALVLVLVPLVTLTDSAADASPDLAARGSGQWVLWDRGGGSDGDSSYEKRRAPRVTDVELHLPSTLYRTPVWRNKLYLVCHSCITIHLNMNSLVTTLINRAGV